MSKKTCKSLNGISRFTFVGAFWGLVLGWVCEAAFLGSIIGAFLLTSIFLVMRIQFALPIEILTPYPERGPRDRTRVERALEPFLCAIIGAAYGGIYFVLGGEVLNACMINGAVLFFIVDFFYLQFIDPKVVSRDVRPSKN
ncbi:MAG: hypothetical protein C0469_15715 [Cyanobacteria bacterium DS2.3.42]|nr:hypothetical protein [Cyanobacteria bacterium DS2.3.42]